MALAIYHVTFNIPDVECGGGFYVRSLVNDIGKGRHEKKKHGNLRNECVFMEKFCHSVYLKLLALCVILQNCSAITCFYILW